MIEKVTEAMYVAVTKSYTMFHANWINDNLDLAWKGLCLYSSFGNLAYSRMIVVLLGMKSLKIQLRMQNS